ncbi:MAG TPA: potassium channel family protein [Chloroflexota bacterium]
MLLTIALAIIIASVGPSGALIQFVSLALIGAALLLALRTAEVRPRTLRLVAVLVVIALAVGLLSSLQSVHFVPASLVLVIGAVLIAATSIVLAERLVRNPEVTLQTIMGALSVYLLIGLFFSFVFSTTALATGTPFFVSTPDASTSDYLYFSFITLATVGYGDLVASTNLGRTLSATEALTGQLYLVTVVALLVSNLNQRGRSGRN